VFISETLTKLSKQLQKILEEKKVLRREKKYSSEGNNNNNMDMNFPYYAIFN